MSGEPADPLSVVATVHVPVKRLEVTTADRRVQGGVLPLEGGRRYAIRFTPDTQALPPGEFKTTATVHVVTASGERHFGARLPVEGIVRPEASLLPARLMLGAQPVGKSASGTLTLQGPAAGKVVIEQIETNSEDITVTAVPVEGVPKARSWRVTQRVSRAGDQTSTVRFVISRAGKRMTATVLVTSFGEEKEGVAERPNKEKP